MSAAPDIRRSDGLAREVVLLLAALISLLLLTHPGFDNSEAGYEYTISQQIVQHGELSFAEHHNGIYFVAPNGRTYAAHEIGNTIILLPVAALNTAIESELTPVLGKPKVEMITRFLFAAMGPVLCAAGAAFLYLILRRIFSQSVHAALVGVLLLVFCSFYWSHSRMMFDGFLCSVLLAGGMFFLFLFARKPDQEALLIAGFALLGFGLITRLSMVLPVVSACVYVFLARNRPGRVPRLAMIVTLTLAPFIIWQIYYNHLRTGSVFLSPVQTSQYAANNGLDGNLFVGIAGLLFSPGKSVFVYCPIALLSLLLIRSFWRTYRNEAVFVSLLMVLWLLLHAKLESWYGSWGWGPRHFVTIVPAMALPFLVMRFSLRSRVAQAFSMVLLAWGFLLGAASILCNTLYREGIAFQAGLLENDTFVWSLTKNQAVDALSAAASGLKRTWYGGPYEVLLSASKIDIEASNTMNLWFVTAHRLGIPTAALALAVLTLAGCCGLCLWLLYASPSEVYEVEPTEGPRR